MPPGQGTGKKIGGNIARQRSRNTTPSSSSVAASAAASTPNTSNAAGGASPAPTAVLPEITTHELKHLEIQFDLLGRNLTYDDLVDAGCGTGSSLPDHRSVDGIISRLKQLQKVADDRGKNYDRGMRLLAQNRRDRMDQAAEHRSREEERLQREMAEEESHSQNGQHASSSQKRANKKKRKAPTGGADSQTATESQDTLGAMDVDEKKPDATGNGKDKKKGAAAAAAAAAAAEEESESESSEDEGAPPPRPVPQHQTFGEDPSTFPDPTVYEIRPVTPGMSVEEIKEIYAVSSYPKSDLADLIAGNPPDKDFSSAKPSNQINFSTFSTYIEPYFRAFTEEDLAFLRERGNRVSPFVMPKRGKRHYKEIWAEEDGAMVIDSEPSKGANGNSSGDTRPPNQPRGSIENMNDDVGETDRLSVGPLLSRLLAALRPEHRPPDGNSTGGGADANGDVSMNGGLNDAQALNGGAPEGDKSLPPATFMPESTSESWKKATHPKLEYNQVEERIKQELRHIGFLPFPDPSSATAIANGTANGAGGAAASSTAASGVAGAAGGNSGSNGASANGTANGINGANGGDIDPSLAADYDGHYDDEIAARLRRLQAGLREQMLVNGARKARLAELVKERMAYQEYQTILEDLDGQVQAAYLKRTRTMGKSKKGKRPGGAAANSAAAAGGAAGAAAGMARPGIGDMTRTLMERRKRWMENIGTVFDDERLRRVPRVTDPDSSVFQPGEMAALIKKEKEAWDEEVDEE